MLSKTLKRAGFGFLLGIAVGNVIAALTASPDILSPELVERVGSQSAAFLLETLFCGLLGSVSMAGMGFFEIEGWPLFRMAAVHYAVIELCYVPIGFMLGWFGSILSALLWVGICGVGYLIVFLIMWARYRAQVREANELIEERKKQQ